METNLYPQPKSEDWPEQLPTSIGVTRYFAGLSTDDLWRNFFLAAIGFTFFYVVLNFFMAWYWIDQPFAGFLHQNRVVTESSVPGWKAREPMIGAVRVEEGDVILSVNDVAVPSSLWLMSYLQQVEDTQSISYTLLNKDGQVIQTVLPVDRFTVENFIQLVAIPFFIAFIILVTAGSIAYLRADWLEVRLFILFSLALVYLFTSFPGFITNKFFIFNFYMAFIGKIIAPVLLLHFFLLFPHPRKTLNDWPFLIPLIYLPVLPALIHIPILFTHPETTRNFNNIINGYTVIYGIAGLILLGNVIIRTKADETRKQAIVLSLGLAALPTLLLPISFWAYAAIDRDLIFNVLERYGLLAVPISVMIAVIRYGMFDMQRVYRSHFLYLRVIIITLLGYLLLIVATLPDAMNNISHFNSGDSITILLTTVVFVILRPLYRKTYDWVKRQAYGSVEDFRVGLRLFSQNLLKVQSRRDLETLISWEMASDFRLRNAELVSTDRPSTPYALKYPLTVSNISLGTFFLGAKISGEDFTDQELDILAELQRQLSLALWSLELDEAIQTTEQLTRLKSKFLTNVTHELRAPLNGIINYIGFVIDDYIDSLNQEQRLHLKSALHGAETLEQIINNILDMSKIEAGQMTLNIQSANLAEIVDRTTPIIEQMIRSKPVKLITEIRSDLPELYGDRLRLRQIILNMLSNAAKFTRKGIIHLSAYPDNGNIIVQVKDTGIGIDATILPTIFQHFTSTGLSDANQHTGPGLSMPITKSLVELHGGRLDVESTPNQGTTFTVTLPTKQEN